MSKTRDTRMPVITFSDDATYDTLHSVLRGWCCRVWLTSGVILTAEVMMDSSEDETVLLCWSNKTEAYDTRVVVPSDDIVKVEVL